ncbi:sugar phosphate isomerase/epimerase family protein [Aporhodopirellula aestuarii]|uniref:Sugar phosphate isomerase/epimerase n=1 Tax=Aporhodopirellula aestuarii TaxID=2950107 RepID=A0ABT0UA85_9BACT|nr:TIM barrel protein [Aporhodopirellula aestuarii]MCM2373727.1 sugar phosphate isomerase/epimerase [Aporhodopirellula aestuarii]
MKNEYNTVLRTACDDNDKQAGLRIRCMNPYQSKDNSVNLNQKNDGRQTRRSFLTQAAASAAAIGVTGEHLQNQATGQDTERDSDTRPVCIFAKQLQLMPWKEVAAFCRDIEVDGIEATIRRGGQVNPADAIEKLPELCETMSQTDSRVVIMTTDIVSPQSPNATAVLRTGALCGVKYYRMAYYRYDMDKPILPQLEGFAKQAQELAALNHDLGITGLYQNHAGNHYLGAPLWDLHQMLSEIPASDIGIAYDVRHATVEGNLSWPIDLAFIRDRIAAVYVKDYKAVNGKIQNVPLGEGDVSDKLFKTLRQQPPPGPVSLHMEYISHTDPSLLTASVDAYRRDRKVLKELLGV